MPPIYLVPQTHLHALLAGQLVARGLGSDPQGDCDCQLRNEEPPGAAAPVLVVPLVHSKFTSGVLGASGRGGANVVIR